MGSVNEETRIMSLILWWICVFFIFRVAFNIHSEYIRLFPDSLCATVSSTEIQFMSPYATKYKQINEKKNVSSWWRCKHTGVFNSTLERILHKICVIHIILYGSIRERGCIIDWLICENWMKLFFSHFFSLSLPLSLTIFLSHSLLILSFVYCTKNETGSTHLMFFCFAVEIYVHIRMFS